MRLVLAPDIQLRALGLVTTLGIRVVGGSYRLQTQTRAEAVHIDFFMGYSGGIQGVFGGILMISKVFGDLGTFSDMAVTTLGATSDPPK